MKSFSCFLRLTTLSTLFFLAFSAATPVAAQNSICPGPHK